MNKCRFQREAGHNTIAVIGDSHAGHLYSGLTTQTKSYEGVVVFPAGCAIPLIGLHSAASPNELKQLPHRIYTEHLLSEGFNYILAHKNIKKVVLSHHTQCSWHDVVDTHDTNNHDFHSILYNGFVRTYDALTKAGKKIYVVLDNPDHGSNFQKCKAAAIKRPVSIPDFLSSQNKKNCSEKASKRVDREKIDNWNAVSREAARNYKGISFIDLEGVFCKKGVCSMLDSIGNMLYLDGDHLNIKGSIYTAPFIMKNLRK